MTVYTVWALTKTMIGALAEGREIELDLSRVHELDGAGLQLLMLLERLGERGRQRVHLSSGSETVLGVLDLVGLTTSFCNPIEPPPGIAVAATATGTDR